MGARQDRSGAAGHRPLRHRGGVAADRDPGPAVHAGFGGEAARSSGGAADERDFARCSAAKSGSRRARNCRRRWRCFRATWIRLPRDARRQPLPSGFSRISPTISTASSRVRHVPAMLRNAGIARTEPEHAGGPVKEGPEDTRGIRAGQAQPFDRPVRCDQAVLLAVRQEPVIGNGREHARRCLASCSQDRNVRHLPSFHYRNRARSRCPAQQMVADADRVGHGGERGVPARCRSPRRSISRGRKLPRSSSSIRLPEGPACVLACHRPRRCRQ